MNASEWYQSARILKWQGLEIAYRIEGNGPPLLCIHGFPSSSWDWEKLWPNLTSAFTVVAPDLIGLGRSDKPKTPLTIRMQADMLEALLTELKLKEVHLLAHDLGDTVAQELLARQLEGSSSVAWKSCLFLNGGLFPETHRPLLIQKLLISPLGDAVVRLMTKGKFQKQMEHVFSQSHPPSQAFIDQTWELIISKSGKAAIPRLIRYMAERRHSRDRWVGAMQKANIPLRLVNGTQDPISGAHAADRYMELIPNADVVRISDAGHYPQVETPERVWEAMKHFHFPEGSASGL